MLGCLVILWQKSRGGIGSFEDVKGVNGVQRSRYGVFRAHVSKLKSQKKSVALGEAQLVFHPTAQ